MDQPTQRLLNLRQISLSILALVYLVIRFGFTQKLDAMGAYASYIFEVCDVIVAVLLVGRTFLGFFTFKKTFAVAAIASLVAGLVVYKGAGWLSIQVPFDLSGTETILFLLVVGPILEELIFRFFLWQPIEWITKKSVVALIATSLIFSYSHFHAYWFVPEQIHPFIIYQTIYTFPLALACGYSIYKTKSLTGSIAIHFAFNLGFYLGSL